MTKGQVEAKRAYLFSTDCRKNIKDWSESEYIEKPVISKKDRAFLDYLSENIEYIARDPVWCIIYLY